MPMEVFIEPLGEDLKCIKLTNKSAEMVDLGGHKLSCTTEGCSGQKIIFRVCRSENALLFMFEQNTNFLMLGTA